MEITYTQLLKLTQEYRRNSQSEPYEVSVLSNIIINQICPFLEYELQKSGINVAVTVGNYDNILQDSREYKDSDLVIIFWELCNLIDGFQYKANVLTLAQTEEIISKMKSEIDFIFENLKTTKLVIINRFSSLLFNSFFLKKNNFDHICEVLNTYLEDKALNNVVLIELDKVIARVSVEKAVDFRNFYSSKALYSIGFYYAYTKYIAPVILSVLGKSKKAIIFDCDNTLWGGILGEDGENGIQMSAQNKKGVFFEEVQTLAKYLAQKGIIVGLNSKNNAEDVIAILKKHKDISLEESDIVIKMVNWNDKVFNLNQIAKQLNIGKDSIVFVDDSDFEINLVEQYQPEIKAVQVPTNLYEYPSMIRSMMDLFYNIHETKDDLTRVKSYQTETLREESKSEFGNIEAYLESLNLELVIYCDVPSHIDRMAQLTQKTNQFNLTTKRYTISEVEAFVKSPEYCTLAFEVNDRFGGFGITGTCFIKITDKEAFIDTFLMSCRVLGRNVEYRFLDETMLMLNELGITRVHAYYDRTNKNSQVIDFYDKAGFEPISKTADKIAYAISLSEYVPKNINYIKVTYAREN